MALTTSRPTLRPYTPARRSPGGRFLSACARLLVLLLLGGAAYLGVASPSVRDTIVAICRGELSPAVSFPGHSGVTFLIMGRDRDLNNRKQVLNTRGRSDLMMLARLDFDLRTLTVLSIPRDTLVRIPRHGWGKINAAHSYGGPALAAQTVEAFLGVRPEHTVVVDFDGFQKAIDAIGGVTLTVDHDMDYDDNWGDLHIHLRKGVRHLNGEQAMGFVRFRKSKKGVGESDLKRVGRQQVLLNAVRQRVKNPLALLRAPFALDALRAHMRTSLTFGQLLCLCLRAARVPPPNLRFATLPGRVGPSFVHPRTAEARDLVRRSFGLPQR